MSEFSADSYMSLLDGKHSIVIRIKVGKSPVRHRIYQLHVIVVRFFSVYEDMFSVCGKPVFVSEGFDRSLRFQVMIQLPDCIFSLNEHQIVSDACPVKIIVGPV